MMELNLFPVLIIACRLSPKNVEGTMYALMMSIYNLSGNLGSQMGAGIMLVLGITEKDFHNLYLLVIITNIWVVSVLPFMSCADFESAQEVAEKNKGEDGQEQKENISIENSNLKTATQTKKEYALMSELAN